LTAPFSYLGATLPAAIHKDKIKKQKKRIESIIPGGGGGGPGCTSGATLTAGGGGTPELTNEAYPHLMSWATAKRWP